MACAAALAVIAVMESEQLVAKAKALGNAVIDGLKKNLQAASLVKEVRGSGLMIGIELDQDCSELINIALAQGLLLSVQNNNVIRLLPPLVINEEQATAIINSVSQIIIDWSSQKAA